jgi:hypothetical protein
MLYFIRDDTLHRFPQPKRCHVKREDEKLRDTIPHDVQQCVYCMKRWPGDED